ncbi:MAG: ATP-binding cassette domain-containing protein [Ruminococcus sp.]|nr:ATP-binding cassette domain-containing protein [Ruminococcus sp.]
MTGLSEFISGLFGFAAVLIYSGMFIIVAIFVIVRLILRNQVKIRLAEINKTAEAIGNPDDSKNSRKSEITLTEDVFLFDTTVFENIKYGKISAADEEVAAAAERAGIAHLINENCEHLTKGERQLVAAARAVLFAPKKIIVGNGLSAVDPLSVKELDL